MSRTLRALPTLLRIGVAETVAYRLQLVLWMLNSSLPLVMLALWTTVASEAPFQQFSSSDFVAYYLSGMIVRNTTESWVIWQLPEQIRDGTLSARLLRPIHPLVAYAALHLASVPLRSLSAVPFALILLISSSRSALAAEPVQLVLLLPSLALAWVISFAMSCAIASSAFWTTRVLGISNLYALVWSLLSGFLVPIALLPDWLGPIAAHSPFHAMLGAPIELMTRDLDAGELASLLGHQVFWAFAACALVAAVWRAGIRHFEAVGG